MMKAKIHTQMECYSAEHIMWIFLIGVPMLAVWVIAAPTCALVLLIRHRNTSDSKVKQYLFILYQGLKPDKFYWEFINTGK